MKRLVRDYLANYFVSFFPSRRFRRFYFKNICGHQIAADVQILIGCFLYNSKNKINISQGCIINQNCILDGRGGLSIGSSTNISRCVAIYTAGHDIDDDEFCDFQQPVVIGRNVWIGGHAIVMPGVNIGDGAVVLPGSIVVKDVPSGIVVGGNPARFVRKRVANWTYSLDWDGKWQ